MKLKKVSEFKLWNKVIQKREDITIEKTYEKLQM